MQFVRRLTAVFTFSLLTTLLFAFGLIWSIYQVFGTPHDIEQSLGNSGIYQSFVSEVLKRQTSENVGANSVTAVPINEPGIEQIVEKAFPPTLLQNDTEQIIQATYEWGSGKTTNLHYVINLSGAKQQLAQDIGHYIASRLAALPACTTNNSAAALSSQDPFTVNCTPQGLNVASVSAAAENNVINNFLPNPIISADTKINDRTIGQELSAVPIVYKHVQQGLIASAVLIVLLGISTIFLAETRKTGLYRLSAAFACIGTLNLLLGWLSIYVMHRVAEKINASISINRNLEQQIVSIAQSLANDVRTWNTAYGLILLVLGVATLAIIYYNSKTKKPVDSSTGTMTVPIKTDDKDLSPK